MGVEASDRPIVRLQLIADGLKVTWGPEAGLWLIQSLDAPPQYVVIKQWRLGVGTKVKPNQPDDPDEPGHYHIFDELVGLSTERTFTWKELPPGNYKVVLARVIGYFDSQDKDGKPIIDTQTKKPIEEGIFSDVARIDISKAATAG